VKEWRCRDSKPRPLRCERSAHGRPCQALWSLVSCGVSGHHLESVLAEYVTHYNRGRHHRSLNLMPPRPRRSLSERATATVAICSAGSFTSTRSPPDLTAIDRGVTHGSPPGMGAVTAESTDRLPRTAASRAVARASRWCRTQSKTGRPRCFDCWTLRAATGHYEPVVLSLGWSSEALGEAAIDYVVGTSDVGASIAC
jgi:hypothetical protein